MENAILAATNLYGFRALREWPAGSWGQCLTGFAMGASILYHMVERHKHKMPGLAGTGTRTEHAVCLNLDRFAAVSLGLYLALSQEPDAGLLRLGAGALGLAALSELPEWFPLHIFTGGVGRDWYVFLHALWHLSAFHLVYMVAVCNRE